MKRLSAKLRILSLVIVLAAPFAQAQSILPTAIQPEGKDADVKLPDFDVASVKQNKGESGMMGWRYTSDGISLMNLSLANVIASAYGIQQYLISGGPSWINSTGFDLDAKVAAPDVETFKKLSPAQRRLMLQKLLADRFHLAVHTETKTLPVYDLVVAASGGPKFKAAAPDPPPPADADPSDPPKPRGMLSFGPGMLNLQDMPFSSFVTQLSAAVNRTVIDKTGLTGKYDISLKWTPDNQPPSDKSSDEQVPGLFTALQEQLGLKLDSAKGPVQTLVIDHVEMPSAN